MFPVNINNQYKIVSELGQGKYGKVYKGYSTSKQKFVAIKELLHNVQKIWDSDQKIRREVQVMRKFNHINLLKLLDIIRIPDKIFIILEFCDGGDLRNYIKVQKKISQLKIFQIFFQIVSGMAEVNRQDCFHRDLKPENIMITNDGTVKIGDFGFARAIIGTDVAKLQSYTAVGSPIYAAPNVCLGQEFSGLCDVWSVGCILYELLMGKNLFSHVNTIYALRNAQKQYENHPFVLKQKNLHPFFAEYLPKMIAYNQLDRILFEDLEDYLIKNKEKIQNEIATTSYLNIGKQKYIVEVKPSKLPIRIKAINNPYFTDSKPISADKTSNQKIKIIQKKQKYFKLLSSFYRYIDHIYNRAALFTQLTKRLNSANTYPIQNIYKYLLMYISLGIFINTVDSILLDFKSKQFILPNGQKFNTYQFDESSKQAFTKYITQHNSKLLNQKKKYLATVIAIQGKIISENYRTKYKSAYTEYSKLIQTLQNVTNQGKLQSISFFQKSYIQLLKENCRVHELKVQVTIRLYHMTLFMAFYKKQIPDSQFDSDLVNTNRQDFMKIDLQKVKERIKEFEKTLF